MKKPKGQKRAKAAHPIVARHQQLSDRMRQAADAHSKAHKRRAK